MDLHFMGKMDKKTNILESITGNGISEELFKLKKKLAEDITDKLDITIFKKPVVDFLVEKKTIKDLIDDGSINIVFGGLGIITEQLQDFRKEISGANTKEELEEIRTKIFNQIGNQSTSSPSNPSSTSTSSESGGTNEKAKVDTSGKSYEIDHFNITASSESKETWNNLKGKEKPDLEPFSCAMKAYKTEKANGHLKKTDYITVVDFTKNMQTQNRFFVINLNTNTVEYAEKCGHGVNSGDKEWTTSFSNKKGSLQSSLGASITPDSSQSNSKGTWHGSFVKGQEKSNNASRGIAIHPVKSLTYKSGKSTSEGCFTIPRSQKYVDEILEKINGGSLVFAYAKSKDYFAQSNYFQQNADGSVAA